MLLGKIGKPCKIHCIDRDVLEPLLSLCAGVTRCHEDGVDVAGLRGLPGQRVLATAITNNQNIHQRLLVVRSGSGTCPVATWPEPVWQELECGARVSRCQPLVTGLRDVPTTAP